MDFEPLEIYSEDHPFPSILIMGQTPEGRVLHVVVAVSVDETMLWVITVYEPDPSQWNADLKTRRCGNVVSIM